MAEDETPDPDLDLSSDQDAPPPRKSRGGVLKVAAMVTGGLVIVAVSVGITLYLLGGSQKSNDEYAIQNAVQNPTVDTVGKGGSEKTQTAKPAAPAQEAKAAPASSGKVPTKPAIYLPFDPPLTVNFETGGNIHFLQIGMELMARDQSIIDAAKNNMPLLRNNVLMMLSGIDYKDISTREAREALRQKTLKVIRDSLRKETKAWQIEDVYFTSFVMQ